MTMKVVWKIVIEILIDLEISLIKMKEAAFTVLFLIDFLIFLVSVEFYWLMVLWFIKFPTLLESFNWKLKNIFISERILSSLNLY